MGGQIRRWLKDKKGGINRVLHSAGGAVLWISKLWHPVYKTFLKQLPQVQASFRWEAMPPCRSHVAVVDDAAEFIDLIHRDGDQTIARIAIITGSIEPPRVP